MNSFSKIFFAVSVILMPAIAYTQNIPDATNTLYQLPAAGSIVLPSAYNGGANLSPSKFNYVRVWEPQTAITNAGSIDENTSVFSVKMATTYTDGFGRTMQKINRYAGTNEDLIEISDNRLSVDKVSFIPYTVVPNSRFQLSPYLAQKSYYDNKFPEESSTSYSLVSYSSSASKYSLKSYSPGKSTVGEKVGTETYNDLNGILEIAILNINPATQLPQNVGFYSSNQLIKKTKKGDDGSFSEEVFDKEGKLICKNILAGYQACPNSSTQSPPPGSAALMKSIASNTQCAVYYQTYYVYDDFGRLKYTLSPKAVEQLKLNSWQPTSTIIENLTDYSIYDDRGRVIESHVAGESGNNLVVYDVKGRAVLTQSPKLRQLNEWAFCLYDGLNRATVTGLINSATTRSDWQNITLNPSGVSAISTHNTPSYLEYYIAFNSGEGTYPSSLNSSTINSYTYYDNYSDPFFSNAQFNAAIYNGSTVSTAYSVVPQVSYRIKGMATGKKIRVVKPAGNTLGSTDWLGAIYYYDDQGRCIETQAQNINENINNPSGWDVWAMQYDFKGRKLREICSHNNPMCTVKQSTLVVKDYAYTTNSFQLTTIRQKIDNGAWRDIASYTYNGLGQCTNKSIGGIESRNYNYNIRGQLTGINKSYAEGGISSGGVTFGESIKYDYGFTQPLYNGSVAGVQWRGAGNAPMRAYGYTYDLAGRLAQADFSQYSSTTGAWSNHDVDMSEGGFSYDANGNILALNRSGQTNINGVLQPAVIDDLNFHFEDGGISNRVQYVTDKIQGTPTNYDFVDGNTSTVDFTYDQQGVLNTDNNKHVSFVNNYLNLPESVTFQNGDQILYIYDASGTKLAESYTVGGQNYSMQYMGAFVYKSNVPYLINHDEGYARYNAAGAFDYYFFVKDHLGNTRNVLASQEATYTQQYFADHEIASAQAEQLVFSNIDQVRDTKPDQTDPADLKAAVLDGSDPDKRIGTSIVLKVMAGDKFSLASQTYFDGDVNNDDNVSPDDVMGSIISTLVGGVGGIEGGETGNADMIQTLFSPENYMDVYNAIKEQNTDPTLPKAYLNYTAFDANMRIIPEQSGAIQVGATPGAWQQIGTNGELTINNSGYLAVYISSEAKSLKVSFDKINITHFVGSLVDENHYYPFGLTVNQATSNPIDNRYLFLGNKLEKTDGLNLYDFNARQYDPQLGRFLSNDPMKQYYSGYTYSANNPVMISDKTGMLGADAWGGMGISGTSGGLGFSMDAGARDAGYAALQKTVSFFAMAGLAWFAGEALGAAAFGGDFLDAAYEESQGEAAEYASARGTYDAGGHYNYTGLNMDMLAQRGYSRAVLEDIASHEVAAGGKVYSPSYERAMQEMASQEAKSKEWWTQFNASMKETENFASSMDRNYSDVMEGVLTESKKTLIADSKTIGLGIDDDLGFHRGTGAITYKNAGWQNAGLTRVDWAKALYDNFSFKSSFWDAAGNASSIHFNVTNFDPFYPKPGITNYEFNYILKNQDLLDKTFFIQRGEIVNWDGSSFVP